MSAVPGLPARLAAAALLILSPLALAAEGPLPVRLVEAARGEEVRLEAGAAALHVFFFAVWCEPCLRQIPQLAETADRWRDAGYRLVLVGVPERQSAERLARFAAESAPPGEVLFDASGEASRAFSVERIPEHVLLDSGGRVVARGPVPEAVGDDEIRRALPSGPAREERAP